VDVALIGADSPLGLALQEQLAASGRHEARALSLAASRFGSERQAKKAVRRGSPQAVVDLRLSALFGSGDGISDDDVERCHWLAKACARSDMLYVLLSRDRVFSGLHHRPQRETDAVDATDDTGLALIEAEARVRDAAGGACVLRTGPLFSTVGTNLLTVTLDALLSSAEATFDDIDQFCPAGVSDVARVLSALLDQASAGADAAGVFHYSGTERTTHYGFAEAVLASAGQYTDLGGAEIAALGDAGTGRTRVLECSRLRDTFAIKQVPWRGHISGAVTAYFEEKGEAAAHGQ
jgi:dTDP-4-dehydrorhamnose reductase